MGCPIFPLVQDCGLVLATNADEHGGRDHRINSDCGQILIPNKQTLGLTVWKSGWIQFDGGVMVLKCECGARALWKKPRPAPIMCHKTEMYAARLVRQRQLAETLENRLVRRSHLPDTTIYSSRICHSEDGGVFPWGSLPMARVLQESLSSTGKTGTVR
jgi:hypothetical protein